MAEKTQSRGGTGDGSVSAIGKEALNRFGLTTDPFSEEHDPNFLLRSKPLRRTLELLHHFVAEGENLIVVVGEAGAGKTAVIDAMSREFNDAIRTARIRHPAGNWAEIGQQIGAQLRLSGGRLSPGAMAAERGRAQSYRVIVNHAEELSDDSVRRFAACLDLEAAPGEQVHRLQIILLARGETESPLLAWLANRTHSRIDLGLLDAEQTRRYVDRRVQLAQSAKRQIFSSDALERIAQLVNGNPGAINRLCRAALVVAASRGSTAVECETIGTAARRSEVAGAPARATAVQVSPSTESGVAGATESEFASLPPEDVVSERPAQARVEVLESESQGRSQVVWGVVCAALLGVIAGAAGFLYFSEPPPAPEPLTQIVEVLVEVPVEVEKIVEVPVEVVKIVEVVVPAKAKPRPARPRPVKLAKIAPPAAPAPAPRVAPKQPGLGPIPPGATLLDRAFARSRPGDHTRTVEISQHGEEGAQLTQTLKLARIQQNSRTLTLGVLTGDVSSGSRAFESRFLSIETGDLEDERFGYRPSRGRVESLKAGAGRDPFHGSSFQYDDFRVRQSSQFVIHGVERSRVEDRYFYVVSVKPRYRAKYERVEYVIDALDYALVEAHYFRGLGLRPYRILQYPRADMEAIGKALVPMRIISRDFETDRIDEARVVKVSLDKSLDRKLFTLNRMQDEAFEIPGL